MHIYSQTFAICTCFTIHYEATMIRSSDNLRYLTATSISRTKCLTIYSILHYIFDLPFNNKSQQGKFVRQFLFALHVNDINVSHCQQRAVRDVERYIYIQL